jgi:hypothetical protein
MPSRPSLQTAAKSFFAVLLGVFDILNPPITAQKFSKGGLALYVGFAAHVFFVEHQKIEGEGSCPTVIRTTVQSAIPFESSQTASASRMAEPLIRAASRMISG